MRPRIRSIKPEMWVDEKIGELSIPARVLFLGMVTLADDEGRFRARRSILHGHIFPTDDDAPEHIDGWVAEVQQQGCVLFYIVDGKPYGAFRHWRRHQHINKATPSKLPPPPDPKVVRDNRVPRKGGGTEYSGRTTGELREESGRTTSLARRRAFRSDPILIRSLNEQLSGWIKRNDAKAFPKPGSARWQADMRLLLADRKGDAAEVARIIDWCQQDLFWRSNILSPGKLRAKFTQLRLKAEADDAGRVVPLARSATLQRADQYLASYEEQGA